MSPQRAGRTLILCFDGTDNEFGEANTNVVQFVSLLNKRDRDKQVVYYQPGIGTYVPPGYGVFGRFWSWVAELVDKAFALYIQDHILGGYSFLMQEWNEGDRVCLFGFSRGAHTARCLAGMLDRVGLLSPHNREQIPFAYKAYTGGAQKQQASLLIRSLNLFRSSASSEVVDLAPRFKKAFGRTVPVDFLGVWDTVESVGLFLPRRPGFAASEDAIKIFRHALSLDERRVKFRPNLWHKASPNPAEDKDRGSALRLSTGAQPSVEDARPSEHSVTPLPPNKNAQVPAKAAPPARSENDGVTTDKTDVLEVWFMGNHSDVGGGNVKDFPDKPDLANIPLRWMVQECLKAKDVPLEFENEELNRLEHSFQARGHDRDVTLVEPGPAGSQRQQQLQEPDSQDVNGVIYDRLKGWRSIGWWIMEVLCPYKKRVQDRNGNWDSYWQLNLGHGRDFPGDRNIKIHHTVLERQNYEPKLTHGGQALQLGSLRAALRASNVSSAEPYITIPGFMTQPRKRGFMRAILRFFHRGA